MIDLENYAGQKEFPVIDGGRYEFVLTATITPIKNGSGDYLNISYKVRDDVDQKYNNGNAYVFEKLFRDKENPQWFDLRKSGNILATQKGLPGYKTKFEEVEEFVQLINGITLSAEVEKKYDDFFQKEVNEIKFLSYRPSKFGPYKKPETATAPAPAADGGEEAIKGKNLDKLNVPDSDLPF